MSVQDAPLSSLLGLVGGEKIAVTGCGGKTSVIGLLARQNSMRKVLVMPTTKIFPMQEAGTVLCTTRNACLAHVPRQGIQCLGIKDAKTGKFHGPQPQDWPRLVQGYDLVLMEADGSRGLPCKGWKDYEPVVPNFTDITLGVMSVRAHGLPALVENVHRLPEFLIMTGLSQGDDIDEKALAIMAGGLFRCGRGRHVLLINQVESAHEIMLANKIARAVRYNPRLTVDNIVVGSVHLDTWQAI